MKLLITILFFIFLYYLATKYVFPYLLHRFVRKVHEKFQQYGRDVSHEEQRKEGETKVDYVPPEASRNKFNPENAEDIDFEEINDH